ncbi:MAG: hypothetical protein IKA31_00020 [Clostridia bacterium]|nr:hypothetical protein [Clostridia bacterium]
MKLPNELICQLDGLKPFEDMTIEEKINELNWCIERCEMNRCENPEKSKYYSSQLKRLKILKRGIYE